MPAAPTTKTETEQERVERIERRLRYIARKRRRLMLAERIPFNAPCDVEWDHADAKTDFVEDDPKAIGAGSQTRLKREVAAWRRERNAQTQPAEDGYHQHAAARARAELLSGSGGDPRAVDMLGHRVGPQPAGLDWLGHRVC